MSPPPGETPNLQSLMQEVQLVDMGDVAQVQNLQGRLFQAVGTLLAGRFPDEIARRGGTLVPWLNQKFITPAHQDFFQSTVLQIREDFFEKWFQLLNQTDTYTSLEVDLSQIPLVMRVCMASYFAQVGFYTANLNGSTLEIEEKK